MKNLSLHIIDIFQNSVSAKAHKIELIIVEDRINDILRISIYDDGVGMSEKVVAQVVDPFYTTRTTRKVGLGIPLFKQNAESTGGSFKIVSKEGVGTKIDAEFGHAHIDRQPFGDIAGAVVLTATSYPDVRFVYTHTVDDKTFVFDTQEVYELLEGISVQSPEVVLMLKEFIENNLDEINN
ncbi:MAG: ATP-binding protein [Bacteroidales bacterium]|jgi:hypothetical protein|nr:ATP-binding protein [Bacteroidales bacterium]